MRTWVLVLTLLLGVAFAADAQRNFRLNGITQFAGDVRFSPDNTYDLGRTAADRPNELFLGGASITAGSGTGVTVNSSGQVQTQVYKVTVASTNFIAAATTADITIGTLPSKTFLTHLLADLTTTFACAATCTTATLSMTCGSAAGGNQYLLSFDADAAAAQFGDAAAELGASITPATVPTMIGALGSWASTSIVSCRLTSAVGNIGDGAATNLSQGSLTFYAVTVRLP